MLRVPARARKDPQGRITPLAYGGGFDAKASIYETLVNVGPDGALAPGLAEEWSTREDGRLHVLRLRDGATYHDGSSADAESVRLHLRRWVGLPEHSWLPCNERIVAVETDGAQVLRIRTDESCALLPQLVSINPCAITAPGCLDGHGEFVRPIGSGPLAFVEARESGSVMRCRPFGVETAASPERFVDFVGFESSDPRRPLDVLLEGGLDAVFDSWFESMPRERLGALRSDPRFDVHRGPGGQVVFLGLRCQGTTADANLRRRIARAVDRAEIVAEVEAGQGRVCRSLAPPTVRWWPVAQDPRGPDAVSSAPTLRIPRPLLEGAEEERERRLHEVLAAELARAGIGTKITVHDSAELRVVLERGEYDAMVLRTLGVPYDPLLSLTRFLPPPARPSASSSHRLLGSPALSARAAAMFRASTPSQLVEAARAFQSVIDEEACVVPLHAPDRLAVVRRGLGDPALDHDLYRMHWSRLWPEDG